MYRIGGAEICWTSFANWAKSIEAEHYPTKAQSEALSFPIHRARPQPIDIHRAAASGVGARLLQRRGAADTCVSGEWPSGQAVPGMVGEQ